MKYKISHTTKYSYTESVPVCHNQVHLCPRDGVQQKCEEHRLLIHPMPAVRGRRLDYFGNTIDFFSIQEAHHGLTVTATSRVNVMPRPKQKLKESPAWSELATRIKTVREPRFLDAYQHTFPSPNIPQVPALADYAKTSFPKGRPVLEGVMDLTSRIHADFTYDPKATTMYTPIEEAFRQRHGVCQDFAHIQICCLRSMGLAARYVSGYLRTVSPEGQPRLVGADASHAWISVFCGESGWIDFDPTNDVMPDTDHITVAWGRDYSDVCPIQGVFVGGGHHGMSVGVDVQPVA
ncbi:Protein-glutamine gamma-glutamyltransferase [Planctomycetes bacterium Pan216]|uniref:Protein-glutamine gamma-glutamyltransferase n=1 Tax=Kolteria novifilia TaxID=2527975 RepID=A0A518BBS1_9BACT|nr:Protein-glutamine gamma-glutamyltransferase [Planctomycetes bacterium Pan216]